MEHFEKQNAFWKQWTGPVKDNPRRDKRVLWTLKEMKKQEIATVLDVGCGPGWHTQKIHDAGYDVIGTDISLEAIEMAHEYFPDLSFFCMPAEQSHAMLINETIYETYDAVVCLAVMNMVEDDKKVMESIAKTGRFGYLAFQNYADHELHLRAYDDESVRSLVEPYGKILLIEELDDFIMVEMEFNDQTV